MGEGRDNLADAARPVVTARALGVGAAAVVGLCCVSTHCTLELVGSLMSWDLVLETSLFFLILVMALNGLVGLVCRRARLRRGELLTVFLMILAAAPVPTIGFLARLIPTLAGLRYFATVENRWAELVLPHVPEWLTPRDLGAVKHLFHGLPKGAGIPWGAWVVPLAFWCGFFLVLALAAICLSVMLRRQWIERERLAYPIMGAATSLLESCERPCDTPIWRTRMLWAGIAVAMVCGGLHPVSRHISEWIGWQFRPPRWNYFWWSPSRIYVLRFKFSWAILGLTYLIPLDVSLSCWFFNLIYQLQHSTCQLLGYDVRQYSEPNVWGGPALSGQAVGAFLFIGVSSLWMGRRHLAQIWRRGWRRGHRYDDGDEIMSYPAAMWGFLASFAVLVGMICAMGTPILMAVLLLLLGFFSMIALTKISIHCGLGWMNSPFPAVSLALNATGTHVLSPSATVSLAPNWIWSSPMRITELGTVSHGLKVADSLNVRRRSLFWALLLGVAVALVASCVFQLWLAYRQGGVNFYRWFYVNYPKLAWGYPAEKLQMPHGPRWRFLGFSGMGAVLAGAMQYLRHHYLWWPFSVVGYAGAFIPTTRKFWFDIFLVWLFKGSLIRYGGLRAYQRFRPFFLGLLMGHALSCGVWYVMYLLTGVRGGVPW